MPAEAEKVVGGGQEGAGAEGHKGALEALLAVWDLVAITNAELMPITFLILKNLFRASVSFFFVFFLLCILFNL